MAVAAPVEELTLVTVDKPDDVVPCASLEHEGDVIPATHVTMCPSCFTSSPHCKPHIDVILGWMEKLGARCAHCQKTVGPENVHPL